MGYNDSFYLNKHQKGLVEESIYLVDKIISTKITLSKSIPTLTAEDLKQTGCIALCYAAYTFNKEIGVQFSTYAYRVIYTKIIDECRKHERTFNKCPLHISTTTSNDFENETSNTGYVVPIESLQADKYENIDVLTLKLLSQAENITEGNVKKGIQALKLRIIGYSTKEIAAFCNTSLNVIFMQINRARQELKSNIELIEILNSISDQEGY